MADQIQVYASALVELLNIKQGGGRSISEISQELRGTIDTFDVFSAPAVRHPTITSATIVAAFNTVNLTVPDRQTWFVYAAACKLSLPTAGDKARIELNVVKSNIVVFLAESEERTAQINSEEFSVGLTFDRPMVLTAGETLRLNTQSITLAAGSATGTVRARVAVVGPASSELTL